MKWLDRLKSQDKPVVAVVGNKADKGDSEREVTAEVGCHVSGPLWGDHPPLRALSS